MTELLSYEFVRNALYTIFFASIVCGIAGSLIVVNRMVFLAGGIAHAAYGGVGLAVFLGYPVLPVTMAFSVLTSSALGLYTSGKTTRMDSAIGIFWAAGMATGIILTDFTPGYNADLMSYLFGSILAISDIDIYTIAVLTVFCVVFVLFFYRQIILFSFDREFAYVKGVNTRLMHVSLVITASVTIVILIKLVGLILVIAMLTIPQHLSEKKSSSFLQMMIFSSLYTLFFCLSGFAVSYLLNITSGASIILFASFWFILENVLSKMISAKKIPADV